MKEVHISYGAHSLTIQDRRELTALLSGTNLEPGFDGLESGAETGNYDKSSD